MNRAGAPTYGDAKGEAAAWVVRVHSDAATEDDWLALEAWLAASETRQTAFERAERLWLAYDEPELKRLAQPQGVVVPIEPRRRPMRLAWPRVAAMAASFIAALAVAAGVYLWRAAPTAQTYVTAVGEVRDVRLADGTHVRLNTDTRITVRIGPGGRRVTLERGEAMFDVTHDPARPFEVLAGDQRVADVGTRFDVSLYARMLTVTVASGVVEVGDLPGVGGAPTYRLTAGDQLRRDIGAAVSVTGRASVADALAWTNGYLIFRDATLAQVARALNRYFATPLRPAASVASLRFSGVLMLDGEDTVVGRLEGFMPVRAVRGAQEIVLQPR